MNTEEAETCYRDRNSQSFPLYADCIIIVMHMRKFMENLWTERKRNSDENYPIKPFNSSTSESQYQRDRARIIHSASFRRLQSKTQVLSLGESDFYRTRLTHSLEVAQIGSGICEHLKEIHKNNQEYVKWIPPISLIEAIGLGHDLGHPPFGHGGEVALNYFMKDYGGFEGNGQTLRRDRRHCRNH